MEFLLINKFKKSSIVTLSNNLLISQWFQHLNHWQRDCIIIQVKMFAVKRPMTKRRGSYKKVGIWRLSHLYASLIELGDAGQLLSVVDVRVLVLSKGHFQLFQLLVAEGGAVASPGRGRIGPAPPETSSHGGLTQWALPHWLTYICFQDEEKKIEVLYNCKKDLDFLETILQLLFRDFLVFLRLSWYKNVAWTFKSAFHQWLSQKRGIRLALWFPLPSGNLRAREL